jgi:hypothetical protein
MLPEVAALGTIGEKRGIATALPAISISPTTASVAAAAASTAERSTRCGASGQPTENASVRQVSAALAASSAFT